MVDPTAEASPQPLPEPYEQCSQYRHWKHSAAELQHLRQKVNLKAAARVRKAVAEQQELTRIPAPEPVCITWDEQLQYCQYYEERIRAYCRKLQFDRFVEATALAYFKRFYLRNTVMEYDPKLYLMTCLFIATKVESAHISLATFLENIHKSPSPDMMIELEFSLSKGIRYEYMVHHPFWPLHGFLLDVQNYISSTHPRPAHEHLFQKLQRCYSRAEQFASNATLTDLTFTHMPSQIGLGCLLAAARERDFEKELEQYLASRFHAKLDELVKLRIALDAVADAVVAQSTKPPIAKEAAAAVFKKLQGCLNPEFDPESPL
ncbi:hypothetical protein HDU87_000936 [Geranomyces variabilis]|uniref:Cyclin-like domain-containing protein n=1 Tax=Geranomyces variabilis TaxID=109894 RepID=A0AAD5TE68_9FUNG|nr:hypothetical protein HDU87_000936 [Geranomyces variabilis]